MHHYYSNANFSFELSWSWSWSWERTQLIICNKRLSHKPITFITLRFTTCILQTKTLWNHLNIWLKLLFRVVGRVVGDRVSGWVEKVENFLINYLTQSYILWNKWNIWLQLLYQCAGRVAVWLGGWRKWN